MKKLTYGTFVASIILLASCKNKECVSKSKSFCHNTEEYAPVCGCDGVTYDNASTAKCNSIEDYKTGVCGE